MCRYLAHLGLAALAARPLQHRSPQVVPHTAHTMQTRTAEDVIAANSGAHQQYQCPLSRGSVPALRAWAGHVGVGFLALGCDCVAAACACGSVAFRENVPERSHRLLKPAQGSAACRCWWLWLCCLPGSCSHCSWRHVLMPSRGVSVLKLGMCLLSMAALVACLCAGGA
jgi:hypothetical protein